VAVAAGAAGALAVLLAGCLPQPASTQGASIASLYQVFIAGGVVVTAIVWGLATWALIRYRRRGDELPTQVRGNVPIEAIWTLTPLVAVLGLFALTLGSLQVVDANDPSAVQLDVTAFRWGWQVTYPSNGRTVSSLTGGSVAIVVPTDRRIQISLSSADVNHAFFVPAFLFKKDAIPGRPTSFEIDVPNAGTYPGACAEYCGIGHDAMPFTIVAVSGSTFDAWLATGHLAGEGAPSP
jgi:cytochrome c oxidase subunit 2